MGYVAPPSATAAATPDTCAEPKWSMTGRRGITQMLSPTRASTAAATALPVSKSLDTAIADYFETVSFRAARTRGYDTILYNSRSHRDSARGSGGAYTWNTDKSGNTGDSVRSPGSKSSPVRSGAPSALVARAVDTARTHDVGESEEFVAFKECVRVNNLSLLHTLPEACLDPLVAFDGSIWGLVHRKDSMLFQIFSKYCSRKYNIKDLLFEEIVEAGITMELAEFMTFLQEMLPRAAAVLSTNDLLFIMHHSKHKQCRPVPVPWNPKWGRRDAVGTGSDVKFDEWLCALVRVAITVYGPPSSSDKGFSSSAPASKPVIPLPARDSVMPAPPPGVLSPFPLQPPRLRRCSYGCFALVNPPAASTVPVSTLTDPRFASKARRRRRC